MARNLSSKYLDNLEDVVRGAVQTKPSKWIGGGEIPPHKFMGDPGKGHRADQAEFRRMVPIREKAETLPRSPGLTVDQVAAQLAIIAKVRAKTASMDNIGRKCE
jgi:hypothetical protein